ncbi:MAG: DUF3343 domain-containing protein [Eubacteriales bacterium]
MEKRCYITFSGVTQVLMAEKLLVNQKCPFLIAPIPREISADCGMCVMCSPQDLVYIQESLDRARVSYNEVYTLNRKKTGLFRKLFE